MTKFNQTSLAPTKTHLLGFPVSEANLQFELFLKSEQNSDWTCLRAKSTLLVDGLPLEGKGSLELGSLLYSVLKRNGALDLFTCSCGIAGCAGIDEKALIVPVGSVHLGLILPAKDYVIKNAPSTHHLESKQAQRLIANFPTILEAGKDAFYGMLKSDSLLFLFEHKALFNLARQAKRFIREAELKYGCNAYPFHGMIFEEPHDPFHIALVRQSQAHRERLYWNSYRKEVYGDFIGSYVYLTQAYADEPGIAFEDRDIFIANLPDFINKIACVAENIQCGEYPLLSDTLKETENYFFSRLKLFGFSDFVSQLPARIKVHLTNYYNDLPTSNLDSLYISAPASTWLAPSN